MKLLISSFVVVFVLLGCNDDPPSEITTENTESSETPTAPLPLTLNDKRINIGDVEAAVAIAFTVSLESRGPQVAVEDIITPNARDSLGMSNVTVTAPYPKTLQASITISSQKDFPNQPVAVRGKVLRKGMEIGTFSTILGEKARRKMKQGPEVVPEFSFTVDIFAGLTTMPETMLLHAEAEVFLQDFGTDEDTLDPLTATANAENTAVIYSNPMHVIFIADDSVE